MSSAVGGEQKPEQPWVACLLSRVISRANHTVSIKTRHRIRRREEEEKVLLTENPTEVFPKSEVRGGATPPGRRGRLFSA